MSKIYIVTGRDREILGIYDRGGLLRFIKEQKSNGHWSHAYMEDTSGKRRYIGRTKVYPKMNDISVTSYYLNRLDYGTQIDWLTYR